MAKAARVGDDETSKRHVGMPKRGSGAFIGQAALINHVQPP